MEKQKEKRKQKQKKPRVRLFEYKGAFLRNDVKLCRNFEERKFSQKVLSD